MRTREEALGLQLGEKLDYLIGGPPDLRPAQVSALAPLARKLAAALAPLGPFAMWDLYVGGDAVQDAVVAWDSARLLRSLLAASGSQMRLAVLEENGVHHDVTRALNHARNINRFSRLGAGVLRLDASANGLQVFGHNDNSWDQGLVFTLPNMTWLSPLGYAQHMLADAAHAVNGSIRNLLELRNRTAWNETVDICALLSDDGVTAVVRVVNLLADQPVTLTLLLPQLFEPTATSPPSAPQRRRHQLRRRPPPPHRACHTELVAARRQFTLSSPSAAHALCCRLAHRHAATPPHRHAATPPRRHPATKGRRGVST